MSIDIAELDSMIKKEQWAPLVSSPEFRFPGMQGIPSDASASVKLGWAAHAFGTLPYGKWTNSTCRMLRKVKISINPLELLASAAAVLLIGMRESNVTNKQITLRGDNLTACTAANTGGAFSPAMRLALRIFTRACQELNIRCWIMHVGTKDNLIADHASRMNITGAENAICKAGWTPQRKSREYRPASQSQSEMKPKT